MRKNNEKFSFYENLSVAIWFWFGLTMIVTVTFTVYSLISKQLYFVVFILLGISVFAVLLCYLLGTIIFRKITVDKTGIGIKRRRTYHFYLWKDIKTITFTVESIETGEFITTMLLSVFKIRCYYLSITLYDGQQYIKPIVVPRKYKKYIENIIK